MRRKNRQPTVAVTDQGWLDRRVTKVVNSTRWLGFAAVLAVAVVAGAVYLYVVPTPEPTAVAAATPAFIPDATTSAEPSTAAPVASGCAPADAAPVPPEQLVLTTFTTTWTPVGMSKAPSSATGGPTVTAPYSACFTRTPEGSLYSVASFVAEASEAPVNSDRLALVQARAARQGNYDKLIAALAKPGETTGQPLSRVSGYRWVEWSPDSAVIELQFTVITGDQAGKVTSTVFQTVWQGDDWMIVVPSEGDQIHQAGTNLRTFTPWGS